MGQQVDASTVRKNKEPKRMIMNVAGEGDDDAKQNPCIVG